MIAMSPIMKAEIPEAIPASMVSARAGLTVISFNMVSLAGTDLYNKVVNDMPMKNNIGITTASPRDHLPNVVFGIILNLIFDIIIKTALFYRYWHAQDFTINIGFIVRVRG
jgi:hypothetical protein